jgi:hypothetical protein
MTDLTPNAPMPTPLSPAAQAVLGAALFEVTAECHAPWIAAAVLRAAADQIAPTKQSYSEASDLLATTCLNGMAYAANELRLIATELENHQ